MHKTWFVGPHIEPKHGKLLPFLILLPKSEKNLPSGTFAPLCLKYFTKIGL